MQAKINKRDLERALKLLSAVVDKGGSKPILSNVHASPRGGGVPFLEMMATDYETTVQLQIPGETTGEARPFLLPCAAMLQTLKVAPDSQVTLTLEGEQVRVVCGALSARFPLVDPGLYPSHVEFPASDTVYTMEPGPWRRAVETTLPFCITNEARKNLMGVHVVTGGGRAVLTATDGHRLARNVVEITAPTGADCRAEQIIPAAGLRVALKAHDWAGGEVASLAFAENLYRIGFLDVTLTGRVIEGKFPNVDQVLPKGRLSTLTADAAQLADGLKVIAAQSGEKIKPVCVALRKDAAALFSEPSDNGQAVQAVPVSYGGKPLQIGFNAVYLLDALKLAPKGAKVTVALTGPLNPALLTFPTDPDFKAVVMPLRLDWSPEPGDFPEGPPPEKAPKPEKGKPKAKAKAPKAAPKPKAQAPARPSGPVSTGYRVEHWGNKGLAVFGGNLAVAEIAIKGELPKASIQLRRDALILSRKHEPTVRAVLESFNRAAA